MTNARLGVYIVKEARRDYHRLFPLQSFSTNHESWFEHTAELSSITQKQFVFCLSVFAATVSMPCVHAKHLKLYVSRKFSTYFSLAGMNE